MLNITNAKIAGLAVYSPVYSEEIVTLDQGVTLRGTILARSTTTNKLVPYVKNGADGNGVINSVMGFTVTTDTAGDYKLDVLIGGVIRRGKLISGSGDVGLDEIDRLRSIGIVAKIVLQMSREDNQIGDFESYNVSDGSGGFLSYGVSDGSGGFLSYCVKI